MRRLVSSASVASSSSSDGAEADDDRRAAEDDDDAPEATRAGCDALEGEDIGAGTRERAAVAGGAAGSARRVARGASVPSEATHEKADNNNWFFNFPAFAASLAASDVATSRVPQNLKDPHAQTVIERREPYGVRKYARRA